MNVVLAAFSSYVLALAKNSYEKRARKTLMKLTVKAVMKVGKKTKVQTQTITNRAQRNGELRTDFWIASRCLKSPLATGDLNCTLKFGQENEGKAMLSVNIGDIFDVKNFPTHFAFVPGDTSTYASIGKFLKSLLKERKYVCE